MDLARRRPVKGRSLVRRLSWRIAPAAILLALYAGLWATRTPRGSGSGWVDLASPELLAWAQEKEIAWLAGLRTWADRIVVVDPVDGQRVRNLCTRTGRTSFPLVLTPDGRTLFLAARGPSLRRIDTGSGRVRGAAHVPGGNRHPMNGQTVLGFTEDGGTAFVASVEGEKNRVLAWDLADDSTRTVLEEDAYVHSRGSRSRVCLRRYALLSRNETPEILSAPDFGEAYDLKSYELRLYWSGADEPERLTLPERTAPSAQPMVTPDGSRVFVSAMSRGVVDVDLTGQRPPRHLRPLNPREWPLDRLAMDPAGRWLLISSYPNQILVYDLLEERWVGRLEHPRELIFPRCVISPDGRWAAAVAFKKRGASAGGPFVHALLLYDLSTLHAPVATGNGSSATDAP